MKTYKLHRRELMWVGELEVGKKVKNEDWMLVEQRKKNEKVKVEVFFWVRMMKAHPGGPQFQ